MNNEFSCSLNNQKRIEKFSYHILLFLKSIELIDDSKMEKTKQC